MIVSGGDDGTVRVWDLATGAPVGEPLTGHTGGCAVAVGELDGRRSSSPAATVRCGCGRAADRWAAVTPLGVAELLQADRRRLRRWRRTVRVWDLATGAPVGEP